VTLGTWRIFVGRDLDPKPMVLGDRQQVIVDLKPLRPFGIVDPGNLHQLLVAELVASDAAGLDQLVALHRNGQLVDMLTRRNERIADRRAIGVNEALAGPDHGSRHPHRSIVPSRRIFRCSCMMP
jgi:hypothetical protein